MEKEAKPVNPCLTCKYADWNKTAGGRLHPDGYGRCTYPIPELIIPKVFYWIGFGHGQPRPNGGIIERRNGDDRPCPTYKSKIKRIKL
jgi:hypothetical protein